MTNKEKQELEQEYDNLRLLIMYHSTYEVIENLPEHQQMIDDILDRMNEIKKRLEQELE